MLKWKLKWSLKWFFIIIAAGQCLLSLQKHSNVFCCKRFTECDNMPNRVRILLENESVDEFEIKRLFEDDEVRNKMIRYNRFKERISHLDYGKTAQFWLLYYLDIMFNQHLTHYAVQTNNFMLRLHGLKTALPFFFALNLQNNAMYGAIYVNTLENLDTTHLGCKSFFPIKGFLYRHKRDMLAG